MSKNPHWQEFTGRKRIYVVWIKRVALGSSDWDPIACVTRKSAVGEIRRARKAGYQAFLNSYQKNKRNSKDVAAEKDAEEPDAKPNPAALEGI